MYMAALIVLLTITGCGSSDSLVNTDVVTDTPPVVSRITPTTGGAGDTVTIFGLGFSVVPQNNFISVGGAAAIAETYALVDPPLSSEIESLTLVIPDDAVAGDQPVTVTVGDFSSNSDVTITVTP